MQNMLKEYLDRGTEMTQDRTVAQIKADIRELNAALDLDIPLTGRKEDLVRNLVMRVQSWNTEKTKNRSNEGFSNAVSLFIEREGAREPGHFNIRGVKAKIELFGKDHAKAKALAMCSADESMQNDKGQLDRRIGVSHAIIRATDARAAGTTTAATNMVHAHITGSPELLRKLADGEANDSVTRKTADDHKDGLFTAQLVDGLVEELNEIAPEGYTIGAYYEGLSFTEFVLYDFTTAPKSVDSARHAPSGMFKMEQDLRREGKERLHLDSNPPASALLDKTWGYYHNQTHRWFAEVLAFRVSVLSRFGLIPLATAYNTLQRVVKDSFSGEDKTIFAPWNEHGMNRNCAVDQYLHLQTVDFEKLRESITEFISQSPLEHKVHYTYFIKGSRTDDKRQTKRKQARQAEKKWSDGGKKGRRPKQPSQQVTLTPDNIKDLKKLQVITVFKDTVAGQGRASSIMNMLANEERQVEANSGILPNITKSLQADSSKATSADQQGFVADLHRLREQSVSHPFGWVHGVQGVSAGIDFDDIPAYIAQKKSGKRTRKAQTPPGTAGMMGKFGHNHGCVQVEVTDFLGAQTITMYCQALDETAISNRDKYVHNPKRAKQKPRKTKRRN